jgi:large subunit ribosomal protein L21
VALWGGIRVPQSLIACNELGGGQISNPQSAIKNPLTYSKKMPLLHKLLCTKGKIMENYAIFQTGGKQYRVKVGDIVKIEKLAGDAGAKIDFDTVLMVGDTAGNPTVAGAKVSAEILEQKRDDKVLVFKKKRRHNYRRTRGHRQHLTVLKITGIKG